MADLEEDDKAAEMLYEDDNDSIMMNLDADCDNSEEPDGTSNGLSNHLALLQNSIADQLLGTPETHSSDSSQHADLKPPISDASPIDGDLPPPLKPSNLPECRSKRSYVCGYCNLKTLNPREYLYHLRDEHGEDLKKIFECSRCVYASKSLQKLVRHNQMVHKIDLTPEEKKPRNLGKPLKNPQQKPNASFSPMNRSPRESKSPRRFEEYEFLKEGELEFEDDPPSRPSSKNSAPEKQTYHCDQCEFTTTSLKVLTKHETKDHLKRKFYRCSKCNYATHIKGRYSKHMKYHEMPIIQCEYCDFSTPYPWNLDRHNKNHTEEMGEFKCHLCNFTAQNKQSLTVHTANHHLTPEQIKNKEAKRTIGLNEMEGMTEEEIEMLRMERDEDPSALELNSSSANGQSFTVSNIDMGIQEEMETNLSSNADTEGEPKKKKPKIKITLKKMKNSKESQERHNFQEDFIHPDDVVHRHGNMYIKTEKCSLCPFKAAFQNDIKRHMKKEHGLSKSTTVASSVNSTDSSDNSQDGSVDAIENEDRLLNLKLDADKLDEDQSDLLDKSSDQSSERDSSREGTPKKKGSFFDKLQEKLSLSNIQNLVCQFCGHESKCLSESVRHQKLHLSAKNIFASASLSTRCQFCRHRCKTTDDLMNHLKSCSEAKKNLASDAETESLLEGSHDTDMDSVCSRDSDSPNKHPMENKVFVWNNFTQSENGSEENGKTVESPYTFADIGNIENCDADIPETSELSNVTVSKKVFRCPQCNFWSVTPNRFHVHIIGHFNKKPYCCSDCDYRSNWRKEVVVHIKLKAMTNEEHSSAEALIFDETCEKNYEKYDQYQTVIKIDEKHSSRTEGGLPFSRKIRSRRSSEDPQNDSAKSSPCPTSSAKMPAPPKLTRAPNRRSSTSSPVPNTALAAAAFAGFQGLQPPDVGGDLTNTSGDKFKFSMKPPPLVAMRQLSQMQAATASGAGGNPATSTSSKEKKDQNTPTNYQIITNQGAMSTSLETLQLLAAGSTNLERLKKEGKEGDGQQTASNGAPTDGGSGAGSQEDDAAALSNQMRFLLWLNCLSRGAEQKDGDKTPSNNGNSTPSSGASSDAGTGSAGNSSSIMQLVLDHEGNPEWKCSTCDFRDNEQETVSQHVRLAHGKKGTISLVHAVHRCSVCGFAAGTKRHVLLHIETSHQGRGGIISRSEGQNVSETGEDNSRSFDCKMCKFTCKKRSELKTHLAHHTPRVDFVFKCMFCPYYVATKNDLFDHLSVHGMEIPASAKGNKSIPPPPTPNLNQGTNSSMTQRNNLHEEENRQFVCDACPFEAKTRVKLMHHKQFHKPRGLPFSCPHCSYNVTRRHLLAQHLKIHGVSPTELDNSGINNSEASAINKRPFMKGLSGSKSPSPSLTITPISSLSGNTTDKEKEGPKIDPSSLPTLSEDQTTKLPDIPLVWVSRETKFFKMFKCRHCPHVNNRKSNIQEHEKMHKAEGPPPNGHKCQWCTYSCINAGVMTSHVKVHAGSMGTCHVIVNPTLQDEQQLQQLADNSLKSNLLDKLVKKCDEKLLYFCQRCPSRFFFEKEVAIHSRFHGTTNFANQCDKCSFCVRDAPQLSAHSKVHTPEYAHRTRTLMSMHPSAPTYPPVPGLSFSQEDKSTIKNSSESNDGSQLNKPPQLNGITKTWIPPSISSSGGSQPPPTSRFKCDQCPSTFTKMITLQYHQSLHRADNPFKCQKCSYAAKTQLGLDQHIELHNQAELEKASMESDGGNSSVMSSPKNLLQELSNSKNDSEAIKENTDHPPIKMKFIGLKGDDISSSSNSKKQFKYYIEEQVPLSGIELLKRKTQIEKEMPKVEVNSPAFNHLPMAVKPCKNPGNEGNPNLHYPLHIDKTSGRAREKRYKCVKCPSAFEKLDQYNVHINLHGSNFKYKCRLCDYSVKFYANFMMHMKRHKYHEKVDAQKKGLPPPDEEQLKYQPFIGIGQPQREKVHEEVNKENQNQAQNYGFDMPMDITTAEKQQLILQHKKADSFKPKDEDKDKKAYYCQYCPYANTRRDAVDSHSYRHTTNNTKLYQCNYCDYAASQPNFIREHTKVHFRPFKFVQPEGFMRHDKQDIWSTRSGDQVCDDDIPKKALAFSHEDGVFTPNLSSVLKVPEGIKAEDWVAPLDLDDPQSESGILVDFRSGDVVEAPNTYIIPLRPSKSKNGAPTPLSHSITGKGALFAKPTTRFSSKHKKKAKRESTSPPEESDRERSSESTSPAQNTECKLEPANEEIVPSLSPTQESTLIAAKEEVPEESSEERMEVDVNTVEEAPVIQENTEAPQEESSMMEIDEASKIVANHVEEMPHEYQNGYHDSGDEKLSSETTEKLET